MIHVDNSKWLDPPDKGFEEYGPCDWCGNIENNSDLWEIDYWTHICDECWEKYQAEKVDE